MYEWNATATDSEGNVVGTTTVKARSAWQALDRASWRLLDSEAGHSHRVTTITIERGSEVAPHGA